MVNEQDSKADYLPHIQYSARELPVPKFGRAQDIRGGNTKSVRSISFSCDGKKVATGTEFKGLRIWNVTHPMELTSSFSLPSGSKPNPHNGHVAALSFSPVEPNILVSGCKSSSGGATVAIWDISSQALQVFKIPGDVLHLTFHPSGTQFAVVCPRSTRDEVFFYRKDESGVWSLREDIGLGGSGIDVGSEEINSLRFYNSGKLLCAVSNDGSLNAWLYPLDPVSTVQTPSPSPDTPPLPVEEEMKDSKEQGREEDDNTHENDASETKPDVEVEGQKSGQGTPREGSPEDEGDTVENGEKTIAEDAGPKSEGSAEAAEGVVKGEGDVDVDMNEQSEVPLTKDSADKVVVTTTAPTNGDVEMGEAEISTKSSNTLGLTTAPSVPVSTAASRQPSPPAITDPTKSIEANNQKSIIKKKEEEKKKAKQLKRLRHFICHSASLLSLSFDPTGRYLALGGQDALLSMFDTRDWICQRTFDVYTAAIRHTAFSSDGELLAIAGDDTFIAIVSVHSGQTIAKLPVSGMIGAVSVNALVWHPKKNWLAYSTNSKSGVVWYMVYQE